MVQFTIEQPSWVSLDYMTNGIEVIGGLFFSDYIASATAMAANLAGNVALAVKGGVEALVSLLSFYGASKSSGEVRDALFFVSVGSIAAVGMDLLNYAYGELFGGPGGKAAGATIGSQSATPTTRVQATPEKKSSAESAV